MKMILSMALVTLLAGATFADEAKVAIKMELPPPVSAGTPKEIKSANLEPDPGVNKLRPPILVAPDHTNLLSRECKVIASAEAVSGDSDYIVDGDKTRDVTAMLQLPAGLQWVQVDLGAEHEIAACCVWHDHGDDRVYHDVICRISNDPQFVDGVQTVFNNDHDNSAKLGKGKDKEYRERYEGRPFAVGNIKGRYVRFYSNGSSAEPVNNYLEIEVYGK